MFGLWGIEQGERMYGTERRGSSENSDFINNALECLFCKFRRLNLEED
jgi:hypothetical protein